MIRFNVYADDYRKSVSYDTENRKIYFTERSVLKYCEQQYPNYCFKFSDEKILNKDKTYPRFNNYLLVTRIDCETRVMDPKKVGKTKLLAAFTFVEQDIDEKLDEMWDQGVRSAQHPREQALFELEQDLKVAIDELVFSCDQKIMEDQYA